jgi:hypothetical protein
VHGITIEDALDYDEFLKAVWGVISSSTVLGTNRWPAVCNRMWGRLLFTRGWTGQHPIVGSFDWKRRKRSNRYRKQRLRILGGPRGFALSNDEKNEIKK